MRYLPHHFLALLAVVLLESCASVEADAVIPRTGSWHMDLDLNGRTLPFQFDLLSDDRTTWRIQIHNAEELILVDDVVLRHDSLFIRMPLFDSEFHGKVQNDSLITGTWVNYLKGPDYRIPFAAHAGNGPRFPGRGAGAISVSGTWETHFSPGTPDTYNAIGSFEQFADGRAQGTFITETGDYRYLEGCVQGDSLLLSCFDGSHAFLFMAHVQGDSISGRFLSGTHWEEPWVATKNPSYQLRNPDSLTFLREGYNMVDFRLPDLDGTLVSPTDKRFKGEVLLVQVMGSWCPNCVDETNLLTEIHHAYADSGLGIIAIAFEKYADPARAIDGLKRFRETLQVDYPIVYAGQASKDNVAQKLPFLDHIMSYPTCIFVDRNGLVRRIRTGFYGPSTGEHYKTYRERLHAYVRSLLAEPVTGLAKAG